MVKRQDLGLEVSVSKVYAERNLGKVRFFFPEQTPVDALMSGEEFPFLGWEAFGFLSGNEGAIPMEWWEQRKKIVFIKAMDTVKGKRVAPVMVPLNDAGRWMFSHQPLPSHLDGDYAIPFMR
jgi:hypothetical protein